VSGQGGPSTEEVVALPDRSDEPQDPHPRRSGDPALPTAGEVTDEIADSLHRIYEESYGRGAEHAKAAVMGDFIIVVLDGLELMPNEELLIRSGQRDAVSQVRHQYEGAIQDTFRAAVERATGRKVIGFESTTSIEEPRFMVEVFKLEPER
jgi:uncharacterized protein YbcI